jgi:hypothetical protein
VQAAAAVGWHRYVPGAQPPATSAALGLPDAVVALNAGFRWDPSTLGVVLTDGVGELELASVFDSYGAQSFAARTLAISEKGDVVRSRHGLFFVPRADVRSAADRIDRLVVPGADAARRHDVDPAGFRGAAEYLHERPGFAFDAAVIDIARTIDVATARWTAKILEYPTDGVELAGQSWPWQLALRPIALALAGLAIGIGLLRLVRRYRQHPAWIFVRHYLEMVVAMLVGMVALGALWRVVVPGLAGDGAAHVLVMAVDMTIGMAAWMLVRRHGWPAIAEMSAAMIAPFVVLLVPYWFGAISISVVSGFGHVLMLVAMLLAMLRRRDEYTRAHASHTPARAHA